MNVPAVVHLGALPVFNSLQDVADEINTQHQLSVSAFHRSIEHARRAGELLLTAKEYLGHGHFVRWRKKNCKLSKATAERYQRLARNWAEVQSRSKRLNLRHLTIDAAMHLLTRDLSDDLRCGSADNLVLPGFEAPPALKAPKVKLLTQTETEFRCPCCGHQWSGDPRPKKAKARLAA